MAEQSFDRERPVAGRPHEDARPLTAGSAPPGGAPARPWRLSGRLLVLDPQDRLLLVRSRDPGYPELGEWWEVPGGGVDPGETTVEAALRELREETGVALEPSTVGPAVWELEMTYLWLGRRRWARQAIHLARPSGTPEPVSEVHYTPEEQDTFLAAEWVPVSALERVRTFPDGVGSGLAALAAGTSIDTGFAVWC
ncbi:NUDIX domain-containing protein [Cryptosporangium phraense]|uniref:NUDIX domain-containing protein n=1 Tax=Cryptosporangium phraense TaxID=2593070 RepID=UPI0014795935|nr:NUDIX domain-containing protein [Cryptosporangium phraense]